MIVITSYSIHYTKLYDMEAYPFTPRMTEEQSDEVLERVKSAVHNSSDDEVKNLLYIEIQGMKQIDKQVLVEKHLISPHVITSYSIHYTKLYDCCWSWRWRCVGCRPGNICASRLLP